MLGSPLAATQRVDGAGPDGARSHRREPVLSEEIRPPLDEMGALTEADRCLECGGPYAEAPCTTACPADVDVPGFIGAIAEGKDEAAARIIFAENLLGGSCARVCPVEVLCEGACVLTSEGRPPVRIGALQRFAADRALGRGVALRGVRRARRDSIAVIGAGPAGLACAGELAARGHRVTVYDDREEVGGLVRYAIAPFRQEREPLPQEARLIAELGVEFRLGQAIDSEARLAELEAAADAIFLGIGMGGDLELRYPGEELAGVWESLEFIEALKTGSPPEVGERVAVIGGGNTAIDVAREALRLGGRDVVILYRRTEKEMPAFHHEVAEAREEGVRFQWLTLPVRFLGADRLEGIECSYVRLAAADETGRRRPEAVPGTEFNLGIDTAIKALGQRPHRILASWIDGLELERGRVRVDPASGRTSHPKYFAGGDAVSGGATAVQAVREGKLAARSIDRMLEGRE